MSYSKKTISLSILLCGLLFITDSTVLHAQSESREPPPTGTPKGSRDGGGTRPEIEQICPETERPVTALVPQTSSGQTAVDHPTLWFYIPYTSTDVEFVEFSILNETGTDVLARIPVALSNKPGFVSVQVKGYSLEAGKSYLWYLTLNCQPKNKFDPGDIILDGWIQRTSRNTIYRWDGVWYDTLNAVASQLRSNPANIELQKQWRELLEDELVNLSEFGQEPFIFIKSAADSP